MSAFPFDIWLRLAVTVFKLSPRDFWAMSVRDWMALIQCENEPVTRESLAILMSQFPDH